MKIVNDKYYTSKEMALYCINKTYEILGYDNISEVIEPSAGSGNFNTQIDKFCLAYDIEPEHPSITKQDYLELKKEYIKGRLIIGNPPFGNRMNLAQKFFKKSVLISDYIAFILPISQLNNKNSLYEFDLIYSEDLGVKSFSDRKLHCCFNIYKRPQSGKVNKKPQSRLVDVEIIRQDSKKFKEVESYDLRMCYWGDGTAGKILEENESYSAEYKIVIKNEKIKNRVIDILKKTDWHKELNCIAMLKIQQFHIINLLKREITDIN